MRKFTLFILILNTSCSSIYLNQNYSNRNVASANFDLNEVPFNFDLIKQILFKFQNLNNLPNFENRSTIVDEEFKNCSVKVEKNLALNKLFESLKVNFSKFLIQTIELYECDEKNTSSAWIGPFSIFYEKNFYFEIINTFGVEEGSKLVIANLAHELGHLIHEYSTLEENSGIDGLSVSGLLSMHYEKLRPPFCENEFNSKGAYETFGCKLENSVYSHYEVDAFGIALLKLIQII